MLAATRFTGTFKRPTDRITPRRAFMCEARMSYAALVISLGLGLVAGCHSSESPDPAGPAAGSRATPSNTPKAGGRPLEPGVPTIIPPQTDSERFAALRADAEAAAEYDTKAALAAYPVRFRDGLSYDPSASEGLHTI